MPAGFTHMTLSREALDHINDSHNAAKMLLKKQIGAFLNGSVGPDIPYMAPFDDINPFDNIDKVADEIHAHHTMMIPWAGLQYAKELFECGEKSKAEEFFAFYLGYLSHVVLDGFTHPFIRDRVGDYGPTTKVNHRDLEMKLDVLVLEKFVNLEANGVAPQKDLSLFDDCEFQQDIFNKYSEYLKTFHNKSVSGEKLLKLSSGMITALNIAEGKFPNWYSIATKDRGLSYPDLKEIKKREKWVRILSRAIDADEKGIIYNSLGLEDIDVFDDVFPKYLSFFPKVVADVYDFVFCGGEKLEELVPAINLDTGRALTSKSLKDRPALWELA